MTPEESITSEGSERGSFRVSHNAAETARRLEEPTAGEVDKLE